MPATFAETAYAKINLALHVRARRPDGYHALETLFAFAEDGDRLEARPAEALSLVVQGPHAGALAGGGPNLVETAAERLREAFGIASGAALVLTKALPVASGLGGGSADAAAALRLLAALWGVDRADPRLAEIARGLGADVPACLRSALCLGTGRGDRLEPVRIAGLTGMPLLIANPGVPLSTAAVFAAWDGVDRGPLDVAGWQRGRNDLEPAACQLVPAIGDLLARLRGFPGVVHAAMSGSGASCFALFATETARDAAAGALDCWSLATRLR